MTEIVQIVQPSGQLTAIKTNLLCQEISSFIEKGVKLILIDFQDVTLIDSVSIDYLKEISKKVETHGGNFHICSLNEQVKAIFDIEHKIFQPLKNRQEFEEKILANN